jgi:beta-glucosidase
VVGETPYVEGVGDVGGPQWGYDPGDHGVLRPPQTMQLNAADKAAVDKVCSQATNCVVIVVSGRPIIFDPAQLAEIDCLVAAWLPGSEVEGVSDPLFGRRPYTGKWDLTTESGGSARPRDNIFDASSSVDQRSCADPVPSHR